MAEAAAAAAHSSSPAPTLLASAASSSSSFSAALPSSDSEAAARIVSRLLSGPTIGPLGQEKWADRNAALDACQEWIKRAVEFHNDTARQIMLTLFTPAVLRQIVNRMADERHADAHRARISFLRLLFEVCKHGGASYSKRLVEAGILPACVGVLHEHVSASMNDGNLCRCCFNLLSHVISDLFGSHLFLSAGVLLPLVFRALRNVENKPFAATLATEFVKLYAGTPLCAIDLRPVIPAPAAIRTTEAASEQSLGSLPTMAPVHRVDSDSLCIISSFLCGCDFLRVIRVCRRWAGLRLKPVAWPSSQPCDVHIIAHVDAFYEVFERRDSFHRACNAFRRVNAAGVCRLLELGVLDHLLPCLATDARDEYSVIHRCSAMDLLLQIVQSDFAHTPLLVSRGIVGKLDRLVRDCLSDSVRSKACVVLAAVLCGCSPVDVDSAVQGGLIPVLVAFFRHDSSRGHTAVRALTYICLRGNDAHRRALVAGDVPPLLAEMALRRTRDSAALQPKMRLREEIDFVLDQLRALSLLLRTTKALDAEAAMTVPPAAAAAARTTKAQCISRAELEPLLEHWHPSVRDEVDHLLREHFD
jgi:hypothetical protein